MKRQRRPPLPQCIAHVPERWNYFGLRGNGDRISVKGHRCTFKAHAMPETGAQLCKIHARIHHPKPPKRDPNQLPFTFDHVDPNLERAVARELKRIGAPTPKGPTPTPPHQNRGPNLTP